MRVRYLLSSGCSACLSVSFVDAFARSIAQLLALLKVNSAALCCGDSLTAPQRVTSAFYFCYYFVISHDRTIFLPHAIFQYEIEDT